jgi:pre-mRNA-splicing factor ATP-dependent RNA helicase DHX38/PRP16
MTDKNYRKRIETPSHPGGLSKDAKERLNDYQKNKERTFREYGLNAVTHRQSHNPPLLKPRFDEGFKRPDTVKRDQSQRTRVMSTPRRSDWEKATPKTHVTTYNDIDDKHYKTQQLQLDRDWYNQDEAGVADESNPYLEYQAYWSKKEDEFKQKQKRITAREAQYNKDTDLWETNRLLQSGVAQKSHIDLDFDDNDESKTHLLTRDLRPPFLDGKVVFTTQLEPINPVRDPTADLATVARKGSAVVKEKREQRERERAAKKLDLAGSNLGNIMGVNKQQQQQQQDDHHSSGKADSQFASHMKERSDAVSAFAKSKTLAEQRQYLPVFAVREELLQVIRDNQSTLPYSNLSHCHCW